MVFSRRKRRRQNVSHTRELRRPSSFSFPKFRNFEISAHLEIWIFHYRKAVLVVSICFLDIEERRLAFRFAALEARQKSTVALGTAIDRRARGPYARKAERSGTRRIHFGTRSAHRDVKSIPLVEYRYSSVGTFDHQIAAT
jgi:hypothetical protein